jgi:hypothetical protein
VKIFFISFKIDKQRYGVGFEIAKSSTQAASQFRNTFPGYDLIGVSDGISYFKVLLALLLPWKTFKGPGLK